MKASSQIDFVYGKGKRKSQLQRAIEIFESYLKKKKKYSRYYEQLGNRNCFSKTDPDATFMPMKANHMRNSQLKPGYHIEAAASGGYCSEEFIRLRNDSPENITTELGTKL